jgi:AraC-like DNA-binding protein
MRDFLNSKVRTAFSELMLFENTYNEFSYPKHFHETYLIEIVEEGTENFYCNGTNYNNIKNGSLVLINPGEVHTGGGGSIINRSKLVCSVIYPELNAWAKILGESYKASQNVSSMRFKETVVQDEKIVNDIRRIYNIDACDDNILLLKELYQEVMFDLLTKHMSSAISFDENFQRYSSAIERGKEYINDNLSDKLSLEDISRVAYISPFHFLRVFKKFTGITLHQYVLSLRIERAKTLLLQNKTIYETFSQVGFLDQAHFSKVFKKMTGFTPKEFRNIRRG